MNRISMLETARRAWGAALPDWVEALAIACDGGTQVSVAEQIGYSRTALSLLVNRKYDRNLDAIERAVRVNLMGEGIGCPVLGEIEPEICRAHQAAPWGAANPLRIMLYRACRAGCPHSAIVEESTS